MKNPFLIALVLLAILIAGIFIGKSKKIQSIFNPAPAPPVPKEGDACTIGGQPGHIKNGQCVADIGTPLPDATERMGAAPALINVNRTGLACMPRIKFAQWPGVVYQLIASTNRICTYQKL